MIEINEMMLWKLFSLLLLIILCCMGIMQRLGYETFIRTNTYEYCLRVISNKTMNGFP